MQENKGFDEADMQVELAELMGAEIYLYGMIAGNRMTVRTPSKAAVRSGDKVRLVFDCDRLHLFDPDTEGIIR